MSPTETMKNAKTYFVVKVSCCQFGMENEVREFGRLKNLSYLVNFFQCEAAPFPKALLLLVKSVFYFPISA